MNNVYFKIAIDNCSETTHKQILTSFKEVRYDFISRPNGDCTTQYEIYDRCYFTATKDLVSMYSCSTNKHFILTGLDGVWISTGVTVR